MKRLLVYLGYLFCTAVEVLASQNAAPYEALLFYFSYKTEWEANYGGNHETWMVPECSGRVRGNACSWDEFVREVYSPQRRGGSSIGSMGTYRIGSGFNPHAHANIDDAARDLRNNYGFRSTHFDYNRLHVNYIGHAGRDPPYSTAIAAAGNGIQDARRNGVTTYLDQARAAIDGIVENRVADSAAGLWADLQNRFRNMNPPLPGNSRLISTPHTTALGDTYDQFDEAATERSIATAENQGHAINPGRSPAVQLWRQQVTLAKNDPRYSGHVRVYQRVQRIQRIINGPTTQSC
jgi:hypothetical protein